MAEPPESTAQKKPDKGEPEVSTAETSTGSVPPKRLPWLWTILLLLLLPAVGVGLWYGGTRHRVEDHPKKVKQRPRRLVPKHRQPMARPAMAPAPVMRPVMRPVMTPVIKPEGGMK